MKEVTVLNNIEKLINKINYETAFIEITTKNVTYTLNLNKAKQIGFKIEEEE